MRPTFEILTLPSASDIFDGPSNPAFIKGGEIAHQMHSERLADREPVAVLLSVIIHLSRAYVRQGSNLESRCCCLLGTVAHYTVAVLGRECGYPPLVIAALGSPDTTATASPRAPREEEEDDPILH